MTTPQRPTVADVVEHTTFPDGDAFLARTLVFEHPGDHYNTQTLVSIYSDGSVEVAQRPGNGATWGAPWTKVEEEGW